MVLLFMISTVQGLTAIMQSTSPTADCYFTDMNQSTVAAVVTRLLGLICANMKPSQKVSSASSGGELKL